MIWVKRGDYWWIVEDGVEHLVVWKDDMHHSIWFSPGTSQSGLHMYYVGEDYQKVFSEIVGNPAAEFRKSL